MEASISDLASALISASAGLGGVLIGAWATIALERRRQRREFIMRQLSELYGPLLSMRGEIRALSELRVRIEQASEKTWREKATTASTAGPEHSQRLMDEWSPEYGALLDDENAKTRNVLIPTYRRMLNTLRDKIWLAKAETRDYFPVLVEFVDIWERSFRDAIPDEVVQEIGHTEKTLHPFYAHTEKVHDDLRRVLDR